MKKKSILLLAIIMIATVFASCGKGEKEKLYVFNWGDYMDMNVIEKFEAETGIEVVYETFATNEEMHVKLKKGGGNYDVVFPSDYMISKMIAEDMLEELNYDNIPNIKNIDSSFLNKGYDPESKYSVPYTWGTLGIVYDPEKVDVEDLKSWNVLWDKKYKNEILMIDSVRDALTPAFIKNGFSINSKEQKELDAAKEELLKQIEVVEPMYVGDQGKTMLLQGEASMFLTWIGEAKQIIAEDNKFKYAIPDEGTNMFFDSICIPKGAKNKVAAEKFIDFLSRGDIAAENYNYVGYPIPNKAALELLPEEVRMDKDSYPDKSLLDKCEVFVYLGEYVEKYNEAWSKIRSK